MKKFNDKSTENFENNVEKEESKDFLEKVFNITCDGLLVTDSEGYIIKANRVVARMLGYAEKELMGKHAAEFASAQTREYPNYPYVIEKLYKEGFIENHATEWLRKDGTIFPLELNMTLLKDHRGNKTGVVASIRDITARKLSRSELCANEARLRAVTESTFDAIISISSKGEIVFWNYGAKRLFGYTADEILGKPIQKLLTEAEREKDKQDMEIFFLQGNGKADGTTLEHSFLQRDGKKFLGEVSRSSWEIGGEIFISAIIRDITERKKAEEALLASEKRFKELTDSLPQPVFELDLKGNITFANRQALENFGYMQSDIANGLNALQMFVPEQRLHVKENFQRVVSGEQLRGHEYMALRKDGTTFPAIIHATPIVYENKMMGLRGILIDITQHKEMEAEILKAKKLESISTLAGGVAQDFNNILSAILGNITLAQQYTTPQEKIFEPLAAAERATLRAKDLTDQLITFAKGGTAIKKPASIAKLLTESAALALKSSNVNCDFSFPDTIWPADIDEAQMKQVFINLIINADNAMPEGGIIGLAAENVVIGPGNNLPISNGNYIKISISDQSIGILNEHLQNIFDPYFTSRQRGSGIGLATTYTIIKNHGGLITVESEFGRGTTFYIYLPASPLKKST